MTKPSVLIVDDNETGIRVLAEMLSTQDVDYVGVQDPTLIKSMLADLAKMHAIFLDLEMPKIDGYELLRFLRTQNSITCPIIAYSVHTSEMGTARELGFDGFIGKPLRMNRFPNQLTRILNGEEVWEID